MISAFEKASGNKIPYKIVDPKLGDVGVCFAAPEKAEKNLGRVAEKE